MFCYCKIMKFWGLYATVLWTKGKYWEPQFRGYIDSQAIKIITHLGNIRYCQSWQSLTSYYKMHRKVTVWEIMKCTRYVQVTSFIKQHLLMLLTDFLTELEHLNPANYRSKIWKLKEHSDIFLIYFFQNKNFFLYSISIR